MTTKSITSITSSPNFSRASLLHPQLIVTLVTNEYNLPQPQIEIRLSPSNLGRHPYRTLNALVHQLAAKLELETPNTEHWIVQADIERGRVYLELSKADLNETKRAMALLNQIGKYNSGCIG